MLPVRVVSSIAIGFFDTYGGGFMARFALQDGGSRLLVFSHRHAFDLQGQFAVGLAHFEKHGFIGGTSEAVLPLPADDFRRAQPGFGVGPWFLNMGSDIALWKLEPTDGDTIVLALSPAQMAGFLEEIKRGIDIVLFIDMRPFKGMKWPQLLKVLEAHPGYRLGELLRTFEFSVDIFRRNARALTDHLRERTGFLAYEQLRWDRRFEMDTLLKSAIHLLLNFLASASALVDHSRTFYIHHYKPRNLLAPIPTRPRPVLQTTV